MDHYIVIPFLLVLFGEKKVFYLVICTNENICFIRYIS